jgi:hypothetical protein
VTERRPYSRCSLCRNMRSGRICLLYDFNIEIPEVNLQTSRVLSAVLPQYKKKLPYSPMKSCFAFFFEECIQSLKRIQRCCSSGCPCGASVCCVDLLLRSRHPIRVPYTPALADAPPTHKAHRARTTPQLSSSFDSRATHARTLLPAALASVPFGFVLVRVRVRGSHGKLH